MFEAHFQTFEEPESGVALTRAAVRLSRGTGAAEADRIRDPPRRPAAKRICRAVRRAAGLADRLYRLRRPCHRADAGRPRSSSMAAIRCRPPSRSTPRPGASSRWSIRRPETWLAKHLAAGDRLGFDPWLHTSAAAERLAAACAKAGAELIAVDSNPLDSVWTERPAPPLGPVTVHGTQFSGEAEADKLRRIRLEIDTARRRCAGAVGFACGGVDLQYPRRRRLAYAAAAVLCAGAEGRPPHGVHRSPQTVQQRPRPSRTIRRCRRAGRADAEADASSRSTAPRSRSTARPPPMP